MMKKGLLTICQNNLLPFTDHFKAAAAKTMGGKKVEAIVPRVMLFH